MKTKFFNKWDEVRDEFGTKSFDGMIEGKVQTSPDQIFFFFRNELKEMFTQIYTDSRQELDFTSSELIRKVLKDILKQIEK